MAALSLATDLGMGQPLEQALRTCLIALRLATLVNLPSDELPAVYYGALLRFLGCTADAHDTAAVAGDDIAFRRAIAPFLGAGAPQMMRALFPAVGTGKAGVARARQVAGFLVRGVSVMRAGIRAHCEVGEALADSLGLAQGIRRCLQHAFERWNGHGAPNGLKGDAIAPSARVVYISRDLEVLGRTVGPNAAVTTIAGRRTAGSYEPSLVDAISHDGVSLLAEIETMPAWETVLDNEPEPRPWVPESRTDAVLEAFADFADLKMPFTIGHSRAVASLAAHADPPHAQLLRRTALLQDLGRVAVPNPVWEKPGPLSSAEWEQLRLHPYYSERILTRCTGLAALAEPTGMHHERMNGSGYHRGLKAAAIPALVRTLSAADAYQAMCEPRPHRPALTRDGAATELRAEVLAGRLDASAVEAVLETAGHPHRRHPPELPAGLSGREVEVLSLIARGTSKKEAAAQLHISAATVDHHVRHIYEKLGVATRAGAAIFAMRHGLIGSELPK
jgi:HD-GYP domain-containing protein (c-di-GMP phosphodiesterase class II)